MAKSLNWTDDGLASTDGRFRIGVVYGLDGQPSEYFWDAHPLLKTKKVGESVVEYEDRHGEPTSTTVEEREVVADDRPHGCSTLDEMHEQAAAMNRGKLADFEAPRMAAREGEKTRRRQDRDDAELDALVQKLMARSDFTEWLANRSKGEQ